MHCARTSSQSPPTPCVEENPCAPREPSSRAATESARRHGRPRRAGDNDVGLRCIDVGAALRPRASTSLPARVSAAPSSTSRDGAKRIGSGSSGGLVPVDVHPRVGARVSAGRTLVGNARAMCEAPPARAAAEPHGGWDEREAGHRAYERVRVFTGLPFPGLGLSSRGAPPAVAIRVLLHKRRVCHPAPWRSGRAGFISCSLSRACRAL